MIPEELPFNPDMLDRTIPDDIGAGPGGRLEGMETHEVRRANTGAAGPPINIQPQDALQGEPAGLRPHEDKVHEGIHPFSNQGNRPGNIGHHIGLGLAVEPLVRLLKQVGQAHHAQNIGNRRTLLPPGDRVGLYSQNTGQLPLTEATLPAGIPQPQGRDWDPGMASHRPGRIRIHRQNQAFPEKPSRKNTPNIISKVKLDWEDVEGAKVLIVWVSAFYLVGAVIMVRGTTYLNSITLTTSQGTTDLELGYQITALVGGIGALLWGISADFYPARRLLIALVGLSLPAAGLLWLPDWQAVGMLLMWLVLGGLTSLTWVLMAESLPENHFAKLVLAITWIGYLVLSLESFLLFWAIDVLGRDWFFWVFGAEMALLAAVVAYRPGMPRAGS